MLRCEPCMTWHSPVQRVYGITFPDKKQLATHLERLEEAKKRDHRNVGTQMELFMFDKLSPGSCFFLPDGTTIYNTLVDVRSTTPRLLLQSTAHVTSARPY